MRAGNDDERGDEHEQPHRRQGQGSDLHADEGKRQTGVLGSRVPDDQRHVRQEDREPYGREHGNVRGLIANRPQQESFGDHAEQADRHGCHDQGQHVGHTGKSEDRVYNERAQHVELAVREIHHVHDAENERQADAHEGVDTADQEAVEEVLNKLDHGTAPDGLDSCPASWTLNTRDAVPQGTCALTAARRVGRPQRPRAHRCRRAPGRRSDDSGGRGPR